MMNPLTQTRPAHTVLITGAAHGLGQALAQRWAERGASVALLDRDAKGMAETARQIRSPGVSCCEIEADLTDPAAASESGGESVSSSLTRSLRNLFRFALITMRRT